MGAVLLTLALGSAPAPADGPGPSPEVPPEGPSAASAPRRAGFGWDADDGAGAALLQDAPTSPTVATLASGATVLTGMALIAGALVVSLAAPTTPTRLPLLAIPLGALLVNFGPNVGDLLNGDWRRALRMGVGRLALLAVAALVPYGGLGWMAWVAWDVAQARHAPARWVERRAPPAGF